MGRIDVKDSNIIERVKTSCGGCAIILRRFTLLVRGQNEFGWRNIVTEIELKEMCRDEKSDFCCDITFLLVCFCREDNDIVVL